MNSAIIVPHPIGASRAAECARVSLPQVEQEVTQAVQRARAPEGSELHRDALVERHRQEVAAAAPLAFEPDAFKSDARVDLAVESLTELVEVDRAQVSNAERALLQSQLSAAHLARPRSSGWWLMIAFALLLLAGMTAFASARLVGPTIDYVFGDYLAAAYGRNAGIADFTFLIALLISLVTAAGQAIVTLLASGRVGVTAKMAMLLADLCIAGSFYALRLSAGSPSTSIGLVLLEGAILVGFTAVCLGASRVLRANAAHRETWASVANYHRVLEQQLARLQERHAAHSDMLAEQLAAYEEREHGHRVAQRMITMTETTAHAAFLTAQAEFVADQLDAEVAA